MIFLSELLKTKRYSFLYLIILLPFLINLVLTVNLYHLTLEEFQNKQFPGDDGNPWYYYYKTSLMPFVFSLGLVVSVITFVIKNIEDKANGWKLLFVLPHTNYKIYLIKFLVISLYLLLYNFLTFILILIGVFSLSILKPEFDFYLYPNYIPFLLKLFVRYYFISLGIGSLTYLFSIHIKKIVTSLLLSIFLPLICIFFSYSFNIYSNALEITATAIRSRIRYIQDNGNSIGFQFVFSSEVDVFILIWIITLWLFIYFQSKKPIINYY